MENVTDSFLNTEEEKLITSAKAIGAMKMDPEDEKKLIAELSNGRGDDVEEKTANITRAIRAAGAYTDSPLVNYTLISPNCNSPRNHAIDTITIHMVWGQCTVETLGAIFAPASRQASSNYGVGLDGRIGLYCHEKDRSWCSSSPANDHRAITIETASDTFYPYAVKDAAYNALIRLCADICKRNGKTKMIWCGSLGKTNARTFASNEMRMTLHKWFAATECPGQYLESRMQDIADKANKILAGGLYPEAPFTVKVLIDDLYIRKGAGTNYKTNGYAPKGNVIIEEVKNDFGRLSDGSGWIYLGNSDYVQIGEHMEKSIFTDVDTTDTHYDIYKALAKAGIMKADTKGRFKPKSKITRGQLAIALYRVMKKAKLL